MELKLATLNINGINAENKQKLLHQFIIQHKIDIVFLQEHNITADDKINFLENNYQVILNKSINFKGGTMILINKNLQSKIDKVEMSPDSRIQSVICTIRGVKINLINVYAHSGNHMNASRDELFEKDLVYYLRHNIPNTFMSGDWNCVLGNRDVLRPGALQISKALTKVIRDARLSDVWHIHNRNIEYTYVRENYGSRIDRIYCTNRDDIKNSVVKHVSLSDHSAVLIDVALNAKISMGKYYWKMNAALLDDNEDYHKFELFWAFMKNKINDFESINRWW